MKRLINFFITGQWTICVHQWEIIDSIENKAYNTPTDLLPYRVTVTIALQCKHCGELKYSKVDL